MIVINAFAQNPIWDQTIRTVFQFPGPMRENAKCPVVSPAKTTETTPDAPTNNSALMNATYATATVTEVSAALERAR